MLFPLYYGQFFSSEERENIFTYRKKNYLTNLLIFYFILFKIKLLDLTIVIFNLFTKSMKSQLLF